MTELCKTCLEELTKPKCDSKLFGISSGACVHFNEAAEKEINKRKLTNTTCQECLEELILPKCGCVELWCTFYKVKKENNILFDNNDILKEKKSANI